MRYIIIALGVLSFLLMQCSDTEKPKKSSPVKKVEKEDPTAKLYTTYCLLCHGPKGNLGLSGAANLQESNLSIEQRIEVISKGRQAMTGFERILEPEEIQALAKYIEKFRVSE